MTLDVIKRSEPIYKQIAAHYQDQIAGGVLAPGDSIPNTLDLARQFNVANQTAQNALKELSKRGLIKRVPKRGSFVSEHLHANTMAIVCGRSLISEPDTRSYAHIAWQLSNHLANKGWNTKLYTPVCPPLERLMIQELERDINSGLVKSVIVVNMSSQLVPWLKNECRIPWEYVTMKGEDSFVDGMYGQMTGMGLDYLKDHGYKRIGIVVSNFARSTPKRIMQYIEQKQKQGHDLGDIEFIRPANNAPRNGMKTMMRRIASREPMPDALFVIDDNITSGVILALLKNKLDFPGEIGLLTHANKGIDILSPVPLTRLEMDPLHAAVLHTDNLLRRLDGLEPLPVIPTVALVPGESCGEALNNIEV